MILFFETYSILQVIALYNKVRKADTIYFHSGSIPFTYRFKSYTKSDKYKNIVLKLIRFLNKKVEIQSISQKKTNEYGWISNKDSVGLIDTITSHIENCPSYKIIRSIIDDGNVVKYYQHYLAQGYISNKISFVRMAKDFTMSNKENIFLVPCENDYLSFVTKFVGCFMESQVPFAIRLLNRVQGFIKNAMNSSILILFPILFMIKEILQKGMSLKKIEKQNGDILQKIIWGFSNNDTNAEKVLFNLNDGYLRNSSLSSKDIIYMFDRKHYDGNVIVESKKIMSAKGIPYADINNFKISSGIILFCLVVQLQLILNLYRLPLLLTGRNKIITYISCYALHSYLRKLHELEYIETKVEFCRDDANAAHIIRTIVSNKKGIKTVGMQHGSTAGPYFLPQLCYIHYDRYCIYGAAHLALHSTHWNNIKITKTGSMMVDGVVNLDKDMPQLKTIRDKIISLYGNRQNTILISFPNPIPYSLIEKWDEMYNALCEFKSFHLDANIFLRFRNLVHLQSPIVKRFAELSKSDDRIIIDHTNFTTYELMVVCDLYITSSHSTGIIEATAIGKKAFTFDYMGTAKYCFSKYGKDIVLNTKEDVLVLFKDLECNSNKYDCNWELLKEEYNYYYDGKCLERIQLAVKVALEEVGKNDDCSLKVTI